MANLKPASHIHSRMNPATSTRLRAVKTILVTGATRGLGLALARALDEVDGIELVLAVRDVTAGQSELRSLRRPARVVELDVGSLEAVSRFAAGWSEPLWALVNNA